jgi:tRNA (Thr-GGU) A37 N-methylase
MYGDSEPIEIYPIGIVRNKLQRTSTRFLPVGDQRISRIELISTQEPFLYKLDEENFITVVYYLHKAGPVKATFKRGLDGKKVGVFASRTPDRLSRIAIQDVKLVNIEKTTLYVKGLDAINGSPVLDIKLKRSALSGK